MIDLSNGRPTDHPVLSRLFIAQRINRLHGGAQIAAWEIDNLPSDWIMALTQYADGYIDIKQAKKKLKNGRQKWLQSHPTYRKYRSN